MSQPAARCQASGKRKPGPALTTPSVTELLQAAMAHHQAGRPQQAEPLYRQVLQRQPKHPEALHLLGVIALGTRNFAAAIDLIRRAIEADPNQCFYHANLGVALLERDQPEAAAAALVQATRLQPNYAEAHANLGVALQALGKHDQAVDAYDHALALQPGYVQAAFNRGNALKELGRLEEAVAAYDRALQSSPDLAEAHYNKGVALRDLGRPVVAAECFRRAVAANPSHAMARYSLGLAAAQRGAFNDAVAIYRRALELAPGSPEMLNSLGNALKSLGRPDEAIRCFETILEADGSFLRAYDRLQEIHLKVNDPQSALEVIARCRARFPDNQMSIANEAFAQASLGRADAFAYLYQMDCVPHAAMLPPPPPFRDIREFNADLAEEVLAHPSLRWQRDDYDTTPRAFAHGLTHRPSELIQRFEAALLAEIGRFAAGLTTDSGHPFLGNVPDRFKIKLWATVLKSGGYHRPHNHEHAWLSGVYYAKVPPAGEAEAAAQAGWLKFDGFSGYRQLAAFKDKVRSVEPRPGLLVLFPSYFLHETVPFDSQDTRISLAFDAAAG